jgi:hypothetical protein
LNRWAWAWWGSLIYFGLLTCSSVLTLARSSYLDILSKLHFPPAEVEILDRAPLNGLHFAAFIGLPLLLTLIAILLSRRYFGSSDTQRVAGQNGQAAQPEARHSGKCTNSRLKIMSKSGRCFGHWIITWR